MQEVMQRSDVIVAHLATEANLNGASLTEYAPNANNTLP
jgi:CRISPR/Cas system type I-B associated protein Csh2 (Cas7 group RAMP superfamily)